MPVFDGGGSGSATDSATTEQDAGANRQSEMQATEAASDALDLEGEQEGQGSDTGNSESDDGMKCLAMVVVRWL